MDRMTKPQRYVLAPAFGEYYILDTVENEYVCPNDEVKHWHSKRRATNFMRALENRWQKA
ncbi:hypothetical protein EVC12_258 [Rhizobium phage RHph_I42]|nr:hypothetical protein EVC12_258 [Rhizobium phage RHph_I42]